MKPHKAEIMLYVKAAGSAMVPDYQAPKGQARYIGRKFNKELNGWEPTNPVHIPWNAEYLMALKQGDLLPADLTTARLAGVDFKMPF